MGLNMQVTNHCKFHETPIPEFISCRGINHWIERRKQDG